MQGQDTLLQQLIGNSLKYGGTILNGSPRLFYAPDEFCLTLADGRADAYEEIGKGLGGLLPEVARNAPLGGELDSPLARDLLPSREFVGFLAKRSFSGIIRLLDTPTVTRLRQPDKRNRPVTLAFYGVDLAGAEPHPALAGAGRLAEAERDQLARQQALCQLINLLNLPLLDLSWTRDRFSAERERLQALGVLAVTPNWGFAAQQHYCPSPGSFPIPVTREQLEREAQLAGVTNGRWRFAFEFGKQPKQATGKGVTVAILDTIPEKIDPNQVGQLAAAQGNGPLADALDTADPAISLDPAELAAIDSTYRVNTRQHNGTPLGEMSLADHGVFIAGIVRDIAPDADVHLGRVLNGFGVSTLRGVVDALDKLPAQFPAAFGDDPDQSSRLIVSLSLGASLPPGEELLQRWLPFATHALAVRKDQEQHVAAALDHAPEVIDTLSHAAIGQADARRYLEQLRGNVAAILGWLNAHPNVLVVAAAGNDNGLLNSVLTKLSRPEPRWPAQYDASQNAFVARQRSQVIGVAAVNRDGVGTAYSNRGDVPPLVNGVAIWGGASQHGAAQDDLGEIPFPPDPIVPSQVDAIKGVFSAPTMPTPGGEAANETGWVYWSGTSFAAPVVAGLAARLWSADTSAAPSAIVRQIVNDLPTRPRGTGPDDLFTPVIKAWQRWQ